MKKYKTSCKQQRVLYVVVIAWILFNLWWLFLGNFSFLQPQIPYITLSLSNLSVVPTWEDTNIYKSPQLSCVMGIAMLPPDSKERKRKRLINGFEIFMKSFRIHHQNSNIYKLFLFTSNLHVCSYNNDHESGEFEEWYIQDMKNFCLLAYQLDITLIDIATLNPSIEQEYGPIFNIATQEIDLHKRQYFFYNQFLKDENNLQLTKNIKYLMFCDTSDIVFDDDNIFDSLINYSKDKYNITNNEEYFWFSLERDGATIGNRPHNQAHFETCFGYGWKNYENNQISCSAFKIGTKRAIMIYLNLMINILYQQSKIYYQCMYNKGDQAVHNVIMYENYMASPNININITTIKVANEDLIFFNIASSTGVYSSEHIQRQAKKSGFVHQYDKDKELVEYYTQKYNS